MKRIIETLFQRVGCLVMFLKDFQMGEPVQLAISYQGGHHLKITHPFWERACFFYLGGCC
ncbi:MAG: hypothetical protein PHI97_06995 [Desulfobulbus sp.]|nr:hypothetical protein [Desulfobulbus sp.]